MKDKDLKPCGREAHIRSFLVEDGRKSHPVVPGTSDFKIYAGSIGAQIAKELLDYNRCVLTRKQVPFPVCVCDREKYI